MKKILYEYDPPKVYTEDINFFENATSKDYKDPKQYHNPNFDYENNEWRPVYSDFQFYWSNPAYDKNHVLIHHKSVIRPKETKPPPPAKGDEDIQ